jgi:glutaredoxin
VKGILVTSDSCTPCKEMKKTLEDFINKGEIEEVNFEKDPDRATELIKKYEANIPSLLILTDDGELILSI